MGIRKVFVRSPYNYDRDDVSRETALSEMGESMTQQSFKEECDINTIVRRFGLTGLLPQGVSAPTYETFEGVVDFHTAMNAIAQARESFDAMPADVRLKFQNDPQKFVEFCSNKDNLPEMRKLGLAIPEVVPDNTDEPEIPPVRKGDKNVKRASGGTKDAAKESSGSAASGGADEGES